MDHLHTKNDVMMKIHVQTQLLSDIATMYLRMATYINQSIKFYSAFKQTIIIILIHL